MSWLAFVARCFNFKSSIRSSGSGTALVIERHYEEDDYDYNDDRASELDSLPDEGEHPPDSVMRPSRWLGAVYEEEVAHLEETDELLDADESVFSV